MKLAEYLEDLDPKLAADLERSLDAIRGEFEERIASTVSQALSAASEEAAAKARKATQEATAPKTLATVSLDAADELRLAALDIDRATSQSEILATLSRGVLRFSSRVAIFVNRDERLHGWSASGFGSADANIKEISLGNELPFPIGERLSEGAVVLSSDDCASICDVLGAEHPSMGILLPFVLANLVVGTVYCDRREDDTFSVPALQLLTYIAGQTLETLPVRKRESTATLSLAPGSAMSTAVVQERTPSRHIDDVSTQTVEVEAEPEPEPIDDGVESAPEPAEDYHLEEPGSTTEAADSFDETQPAGPEDGLAPLEAGDEESTRPGQPAPEPEPPAAPPSTSAAPLYDADEATAAPIEPVGSPSSTQVAPPSDLQGPGWAFTSGSESNEASSESEHEEAQRLARLLVTEIKLYNEETVEQGRRDGDVYSRLREDIDRSRQIFEDRIDPEVRDKQDYFKQALVRILAGGDSNLLGI